MKKFLYGMVSRTCGRGNGDDTIDGVNTTLLAWGNDRMLGAVNDQWMRKVA